MLWAGVVLCAIDVAIIPSDFPTLILGIVLFVVILFTSTVEIFQKIHQGNVLKRLQKMVAQKVKVMR